ncbi:ABC-type multidrug transport system, ATPase component [Streptomyces sp. WMMB 322]|nr:ABC-type multidrug transport system, ATPase component [Streptomyces sp. WMMB 322]
MTEAEDAEENGSREARTPARHAVAVGGLGDAGNGPSGGSGPSTGSAPSTGTGEESTGSGEEGNAALEALGLGMGYARSRQHVLRDCTFRLPAGRICGLVGPNGAGKSTLLAIAAGLMRPTEGTVRLLGTTPAAARERIAYVAQHKPLYPQLTVEATLRLGAELNPRRWDQDAAERIAYGGDGIAPRSKVRTLSGGLRTRVSLALAFGKSPELLLLDEPMADIDPLARHELTGALMADAAGRGTTIVMSSHVVADLEGACDYLLLLGSGRIRLAGDQDGLMDAHRVLTGLREDFGPHQVVEEYDAGRGRTALVRTAGGLDAPAGTGHADDEQTLGPDEGDAEPDEGAEGSEGPEESEGSKESGASRGAEWAVEEPTLEELLLGYLRNPDVPDLLLADAVPAGAVPADGPPSGPVPTGTVSAGAVSAARQEADA